MNLASRRGNLEEEITKAMAAASYYDQLPFDGSLSTQ
jgi:hypothetical protein